MLTICLLEVYKGKFRKIMTMFHRNLGVSNPWPGTPIRRQLLGAERRLDA